jgi:hypothetical protein
VIERLLIERAELAVRPGMLDVARHAVALDVAVDADAPRDAVGDRLMARETLVGHHAAPTLVAFLAARDALQIRVRLRQRTRRDERAQLRVGSVRHRRQPEQARKAGNRKSATSHEPYHRNGT